MEFIDEYKDIKFDKESAFLITGGAGFIGSNLCETLLNMGYKVRCLDDLSTGKKENIEPFINNPNFEFIQGSICDLNTCISATKNVDYVLNEAALGSVARSINEPLLYEQVNIKGTLNMLEASRINKVKKFIYASSSSVFGDTNKIPMKEGKEGRILSPYALTKHANEQYAKLYTSLYNLDTYGLRYFNVFGKNQNPNGQYAAVIPKFILNVLEGKVSTINGDGNVSRDFTYIKNVVYANLKACMAPSNVAGEVYNIGCGKSISINEVYKKISTLLGKDITPKFASERKGEIKHSIADIRKSIINLKYTPKCDFEFGIEETVKWYVNNYEVNKNEAFYN